MSLLMQSVLRSAGCALVLCAMMASAAALAPDRVYAKAAPSVWRVVVFDESGKPFGQGSAVVVGKESLLRIATWC